MAVPRWQEKQQPMVNYSSDNVSRRVTRMATADMSELSERIAAVRKRISRHRRRPDALGEQNTKGALIEPVLQALGWDISDPDEVHREFKAERQDGPVDYALKAEGSPQILAEAKALEESLDNRRWVSQVVSYASVAGVRWCVLTNPKFPRWEVYESLLVALCG